MLKTLSIILLSSVMLFGSKNIDIKPEDREQVAKVMDELQKMLPMPMDELTKWEKAELKADTVIYTFKIYEKDAKITKEQSKKVKDQLCINPTVKTLALAGFKVRSIYTGLNDKEVASVTVDTKACGYKK